MCCASRGRRTPGAGPGGDRDPHRPELFARLEAFIGKPLIEKEQRRYALAGGLVLEVNQVDRGQPGEFFYAEVEFSSLEQAQAWQPDENLKDYLSREVTGQRGESMAAYWQQTR